MTQLLDPPIRADTTRITADISRLRPVDAIRRRARNLLAPWFADDAPVLDGLLTGTGSLLAFTRSLAAYAKRQTRVATSTGLFLDLTATDFFGTRLQRRSAEEDADYSLRIRREVLRPRVTRDAISHVVTDLTGIAPDILEPWNPGDCGAYDVGTLAYAGEGEGYPVLSGFDGVLGGYDAGSFVYDTPVGEGGTSGGAGCWGSLELPNQFFITVHRPPGVFAEVGECGAYDVGTMAYGGGFDGIPTPSGYDEAFGAYDVGDASYDVPPGPYGAFAGAGFWADEGDLVSITDAEIYATIAETTAAGVIAWTRIRGA